MSQNNVPNVPRLIKGRKTSRQTLKQLKALAKKGDVEHIVKITDGSFSITTADRFQYSPLYSDIGVHVLPDKGGYCDADMKFNLSNAEMAYQIFSDARFVVLGWVLHVYETGSTVLSTTEYDFDGASTMEEFVDGMIPADGYDHDFVIFGQVEQPIFTPRDKYECWGIYDFTDIYQRIIADWFRGPEPRDRKYEIGYLIYSPGASNTIYHKLIKVMRGRFMPLRSALI